MHDMVIKIVREEQFIGPDDIGSPSFSIPSRQGNISKSIYLSAFTANSNFLRTLMNTNMESYEVIKIFGNNTRHLKRPRILDFSFSPSADVNISDSNYCLPGIGFLSHLICLKINNCTLQKLPDSIGNLDNLQVLCLYHWPNLRRLPQQMTKLHQLTIMQVGACVSLQCMPMELSKLGNLQTLWGFRPAISKDKDGARLKEL